MSLDNPVVLSAIAVIVISLAIAGAIHFFSPGARLERRRRRSNNPIASKSKRPMVRFSVRTRKDE
jgi:hypothetical protein